MKKTWMEPQIEVQQFAANEYIAVCKDVNSVYEFVCSAGNGAKGDVFDSNGNNLTKNGGGWFGSRSYYYACGKTHEAPTTDDFISGTFYYNGGNDRTYGYESIPVIIWTEGGTNVHCTTNLDIRSWEVEKS